MDSQEKKNLSIIDINSAVGNLPIKFWHEYVGTGIEKQIICHVLRHEEHKNLIDYKYTKKESYQDTTMIVRYLPKEIKVPNTMYVYDNKAVIISPREENWALVVESQSFSESMRVFHGVLWQMSR